MPPNKEAATKDDIQRLDKRIDGVVEDVGRISNDVSEIKGFMGPVSEDVKAIKNHFIEQGSQVAQVDNQRTTELFKTIRWLLVVLILGCAIVAGFSQFKGKAGDIQVETSK